MSHLAFWGKQSQGFSWQHSLEITMGRFSIKPGDQTDETESPNLVKKTGLTKR